MNKNRDKDTLESIDYIMGEIRKGLALDADEKTNGSFRSVVRLTEQLVHLIKLAAIIEERHDDFRGPIIKNVPNV